MILSRIIKLIPILKENTGWTRASSDIISTTNNYRNRDRINYTQSIKFKKLWKYQEPKTF